MLNNQSRNLGGADCSWFRLEVPGQALGHVWSALRKHLPATTSRFTAVVTYMPARILPIGLCGGVGYRCGVDQES